MRPQFGPAQTNELQQAAKIIGPPAEIQIALTIIGFLPIIGPAIGAFENAKGAGESFAKGDVGGGIFFSLLATLNVGMFTFDIARPFFAIQQAGVQLSKPGQQISSELTEQAVRNFNKNAQVVTGNPFTGPVVAPPRFIARTEGNAVVVQGGSPRVAVPCTHGTASSQTLQPFSLAAILTRLRLARDRPYRAMSTWHGHPPGPAPRGRNPIARPKCCDTKSALAIRP